MMSLPILIPNYFAPSLRWEHVPIAHWLIAQLKPHAIVDMGGHDGISFFAFCQAIKHYGANGYVYAIDGRPADKKASCLGDDIYLKMLAHQNAHYAQISTLLRQSYEEASACFDDLSIDLLHVDGLYTYEAVSHIHNIWRPKLSDNGSIVYHNINIRNSQSGVWRFWEQIKADSGFSCLEIRQGSGLGIVTCARNAPCWHRELEQTSTSLRSLGTLYLSLAEQHQSLQQQHAQYSALSAEIDHLRAQMVTSDYLNNKTPITVKGASIVKHLRMSLRHQLAICAERLFTYLSKSGYFFKETLSRYASHPLVRKYRNVRSLDRQQLRIVCISGEPHTPGHRYRVLRAADAYQALGAHVSILHPSDIRKNLSEIASSDLLMLWRIPWSANLNLAITVCRRKGGKVLFDVDDLMISPNHATASIIDGIRSNEFDESETAKLFARMQRTMLAADLCITTTHELAAQIRLHGKPVMILANGYDEDTFKISRLAYRQRKQQGSDGFFRIGYASGSLTHQRDFQCCAQAVANILLNNPHCRLVLFRDKNNSPCLDIEEFPCLNTVQHQIEWRNLVPLEKLPYELASFDINIIPLEIGNVFTEAKSELKFFEAALVGTCSIASPTGPFRRIIRHSQNGLLASSLSDWQENLQSLISHSELRERMAENALLDILYPYGPIHRMHTIGKLVAYSVNPHMRSLVFELMLQNDSVANEAPTLSIPTYDLIYEYDSQKPSNASVLVSLYHQSHHLEESLESIKAQTLDQLELIIIVQQDADSRSSRLVRWLESNYQHFSRIILARNRDSSHLGSCGNLGFYLAETDYILTINTDGLLAPRCLELCLQSARERKAALVYPVIQELRAKDQRNSIHAVISPAPTPGHDLHAIAFVAKAAWLTVGGYQNLRDGWDDYDLYSRIAELGLLSHHLQGEALAFIRVSDDDIRSYSRDVQDNPRYLSESHGYLQPQLHINDRHQLVEVPCDMTPQDSSSSLAGRDSHAESDTSRVNGLLPILRCPLSHGRLTFVGDHLYANNVSETCWSLVRGVPNLFAGLYLPEIKNLHETSHPLPHHISAKIADTSGLVMNLSAGGSAEKIPHVVEVEASLFRHTDIIADAHHLPFVDECFDGVVCMNAFEHYHSPSQVAAELLRVLKPGGWLIVQTAFLQPEHEYPRHYYNVTSEGLKSWFASFCIDDIRVSDNFNPFYALSWLASECESSLGSDVSQRDAELLRSTRIATLIDAWRQSNLEDARLWKSFSRLSQRSQRPIAAGFELLANKPFPPKFRS